MKEIRFDKNGKLVLIKINYKINHKNEIENLVNETKKDKKEMLL